MGISLEQKLEALPEVERAFVHLNCENIITNSNSITIDQDQQLIPAVSRRQHKIV